MDVLEIVESVELTGIQAWSRPWDYLSYILHTYTDRDTIDSVQVCQLEDHAKKDVLLTWLQQKDRHLTNSNPWVMELVSEKSREASWDLEQCHEDEP